MDGKLGRYFGFGLVLLLITFNSGCIGLAAHLLYFFKGNRVEAEFKGLADKRVAVICVSDAAMYGPDETTEMLAKYVRHKLNNHVKKIRLVGHNEIENWIDNHDWDQIDYLEIARGVDADIIVAIELEGYLLENSAALYRGNTSYSVQVYDLSRESGSPSFPVFEKGPNEFSFPKDHPYPSTGLTQRKFEQMFISELGEQISGYFCGYEYPDKIARDAARIR